MGSGGVGGTNVFMLNAAALAMEARTCAFKASKAVSLAALPLDMASGVRLPSGHSAKDVCVTNRLHRSC